MTAQYVPIIKGKVNDLKALGRLSPKLRALTKPLIETMPHAIKKKDKKQKSLEAHIFSFCEYIRKHVPLGDVSVDFYGLMPDAELPDGTNAVLHGFRLLKALGRTVTPVFGLERNDDLWVPLGQIARDFGTGFGFRLRRDDLADDLHDETWQQISERSAEMGLAESEIDIILDFAEVLADEREQLAETAISFLFTNPRIRHYRSIVVAGSSALRTVKDVEKDGMGTVVRNELHLWSALWRDMPDDLKPIYGDYGVVHPDFSDMGSSKYMNAKIRYTVGDKILYFRGHGLHHPIKDYEQYHSLARQVVADVRFRGRSHSLGDAYVEDCARELIGHGAAATWVAADMNHHLTYACAQIGRLLEQFAIAPEESEASALLEAS